MYSRNELLDLRGRHMLPPETITLMKSLNILKRNRGRRSGRHTRRQLHITVVVSRPSARDYHHSNKFESQTGMCILNLVDIPQSIGYNCNEKSYHLPSVFLCNPRSLNNKLDEYRSVVLDNNFDLCAVSESWFLPDKSVDYYNIEGYTLFSRPRTTRIGGGVALYTKEDLHAKAMTVDIPNDLEIIWIQCRPKRLPRAVSIMIFAAVYFPDKTMENQMIHHIQDTLDIVRAKHPDAGICILGDINHLDVKPLCNNNRLTQVVKQPTRGVATLDKILTNMTEFYHTPNIASPIGLSDHSTVMWFPKQHKGNSSNSFFKRTVRPIKESGIREFGTWITHYDWVEVHKHDSVTEKADAFYETLHQRLHRHFPTREVKTHVADKPWMTPKTKALIRRRQGVFDHSRPALWRFYRNKVNRAIKSDKHEYYNNRVEILKKSNPAQWYRHIRVMTTKNKQQPIILPPPRC